MISGNAQNEPEHTDTRCYSADIRELPSLSGELIREMPCRRARALHACQRPEDKLRGLAGWLLMKRFLGKDAARRLAYGRYGKPYLRGGPYFNLSHSGHYAVLVVSTVPVGVDVEQRRDDDDCAALAAAAFHPSEREHYARHPSVRTFFDIWTLKESYLKLRGTGLSVEPSSFALTLERGGARLHGRPEIRFRLYDDLPGHSLAVCLMGGSAPDAVTMTHF